MSPDKWERWEMQSSSFDPGRMAEEVDRFMATEEQPTKKAKTWAHSIDNSTVHKLNFKEKVNWDKATHPDAFPKDKPQDMLCIKPMQLENYQTKVKTEYWGLLMNGPKGWKQNQEFLNDMNALCRVGKCV